MLTAAEAQEAALDALLSRADCITWAGRIDRHGYGRSGKHLAHRVMYEEVRGAIPQGLDIDHLCRNRACVNPWHLEPVTRRENTLRGNGLAAQLARRTACQHGHEYTPDNTRLTGGTRYCRACDRRRAHEWRMRRMQAAS